MTSESPRQNEQSSPHAHNTFDFGREGPINPDELKVSLDSLGYQYNKEDIQRLIMQLDPQNTGTIDYQEFFDLIQEKVSQKDKEEQIKMTFNMLDSDRKGKITFKDLKKVAEALGEEISDQEIREMINEADTDNNGEISYEEFVSLVRIATND